MNPNSGKRRRRCIRSMMQRSDLEEICARRAERYRIFVEKVGRDSCLAEWGMSLWHDAEYALSLREGYYDPSSELNKHVMRTVREKSGRELTADDLREHRRRVMQQLGPCLVSAGLPPEYGCFVRYYREHMQRRGAIA